MRYANEKHLNFVRSFQCSLLSSECWGGVEAHHLMRPFSGTRGMGMKSGDMNVIPLCHGHHMGLHHLGNEEKFFMKHDKTADFGRLTASRLWLTSPHYTEETGVKHGRK